MNPNPVDFSDLDDFDTFAPSAPKPVTESVAKWADTSSSAQGAIYKARYWSTTVERDARRIANAHKAHGPEMAQRIFAAAYRIRKLVLWEAVVLSDRARKLIKEAV